MQVFCLGDCYFGDISRCSILPRFGLDGDLPCLFYVLIHPPSRGSPIRAPTPNHSRKRAAG